ncbi:uncharacterized protein K02A2.6-like [Hydractinia symbiolongicarpus]|uniref:uncharacterized protein K02A2.6-like n=1 Tax=Hydractinia symbiolongicarpus TaxID=13093 RepID=UPI0025515F3C|nr:uncharacterized protein K02A2.6-like [Hydractinia symbiolongicarpus]
MDYLGPLPDGKYALAMIDQRSRYPLVSITPRTSAKNLISILNTAFTKFGYLETIITDNGPPFRSNEIKRYMKIKGIKHRRVTPLCPQANNEIERLMLPLMKIICTAHVEHKPYIEEVEAFLMAYRVTPHVATNIPPADSSIDEFMDEKLTHNDQKSKKRSKRYRDNRNQARHRELQVGDCVLVKQKRKNKLTPPYNPIPYRVTDTRGTMINAQNQRTKCQLSRNISHVKKIPEETKEQPTDIDFEEEEEDEGNHGGDRTDLEVEQPQTIPPLQQQEHTTTKEVFRKTYPRRIRRPPNEWSRRGSAFLLNIVTFPNLSKHLSTVRHYNL